MSYDAGSTRSMRRAGTARVITPEDERQAMLAVCGARACQGAADAKHILQVLGLIDSPEPERKPQPPALKKPFYGNQYV
jgi:hypothetical protein